MGGMNRGGAGSVERSAAAGVDWDRALRLARAGTPAGPHLPGAVRRGAVALLRRSADDTLPWAAQLTGLTAPARVAADTTEVLVVDRIGLQRANAAFLRALMERVPDPSEARPGPSEAVGRAVVSSAIAGLLGLISTRVLGQVLPADAGERGARMLLVAPNVAELQRLRDLDRIDLSAWVALHEATHVLQLAAAPWLTAHLTTQVEQVATALMRPLTPGEPTGLVRLARAVRAGATAHRGAPGDAGTPSPLLTDRLGAAEREQLAAITATMALLEGHAEAVLDAVEPSRMPSVYRLRAVLGHARDGVAGTLLERLLGVEAKQTQYVDGAAFVRGVVGRVGQAGLNAVWREPANLPRPEEIGRPEAWIERMGL